MYQLNTPQIPDKKIPKGMPLIDTMVFEQDDERFQVAYEKGKSEGSFMRLTLDNTILNMDGMKITQTI